MESIRMVIQVVLAILAVVALFGVYMVVWGANAAGYGSIDASGAIFVATVALWMLDKSFAKK